MKAGRWLMERTLAFVYHKMLHKWQKAWLINPICATDLTHTYFGIIDLCVCPLTHYKSAEETQQEIWNLKNSQNVSCMYAKQRKATEVDAKKHVKWGMCDLSFIKHCCFVVIILCFFNCILFIFINVYIFTTVC